jgi:hypothetical protein
MVNDIKQIHQLGCQIGVKKQQQMPVPIIPIQMKYAQPEKLSPPMIGSKPIASNSAFAVPKPMRVPIQQRSQNF